MTAPGLFDTVLLDVNGTLVPSVARPPEQGPALRRFRALVRRLTAAGVRVGLCSDSPLEQLRELGTGIGLEAAPGFPVIAENGNVVADGAAVRVVTPFPALPQVRAEVERAAVAHGLRRAADVTAPEFGGGPPAPGTWAFGANRRASAGVFGPPDFVRDAARCVALRCGDDGVEVSVGLSPDGSCAGIHPYAPAELGKRTTLARLAGERGRRVLMVGNSPADWIPGVPGVACAFVADDSVPDDVRDAAWYVSPGEDLEGVVDILGRVVRRAVPRGAARS
ncbi:HAD family hydrolase [Streptantibioticus silvisoli]|uniref:HAD family phosphatase n=1 Tax=Streptantibioticus silvisoli TaxID=2705255 RepID=A0ABT6VSN6_9ACTN|nr:hypothetical protein [Streptantibioticus silvisoli]MDI5961479.1 hypothetical protein [Streptantibioticus silvisoli]